jgi:hypothetical protein
MQGWTVKRIADGAAYYPPEGGSVGAIVIRERRRPLEPVARIVEHDTARMLETTLASAKLEESEQIITGEGEHGALYRTSGVSKIDGSAIEYIHAFVFGDDFYDRFDCYCGKPDEFLAFRISVRDVVFAHRLGLGKDRIRRFLYDPPPGWQGLSRNLYAEWFPLDYPKRHSKIVVAPATPETPHNPLDLGNIAFGIPNGFVRAAEVRQEPMTSVYGLSGTAVTIFGQAPNLLEPLEIKTVSFQDDRYLYLLRLETTPADSAAANEIFAAVCRSARPAPYSVSRESDLWVAWDKAPV